MILQNSKIPFDMTGAKKKSLEHMNDSTLQKICTPTAEQISQHEQPIACEKLLTVTKYHVKRTLASNITT